MADAPPPPRFLLWSWAACRALWITIFPLLCGAGMLWASWFEYIRVGRFSAPAINSLVIAVLLLALAWSAASHTWKVLAGTKPATAAALSGEILSTAVVFLVCGLLLAMVGPYFRPVFRRSAEGAMNNRLHDLRGRVESYRAAHEGQFPPSLEALGEPPPLWPRASKIPHPGEAATILLPDAAATDSGKWAYALSASSATVFIDCTHTDYRGVSWTSY